MDTMSVLMLGREYASALLASERAHRAKTKAVNAFEEASKAEQRAARMLKEAVDSNLNREDNNEKV